MEASIKYLFVAQIYLSLNFSVTFTRFMAFKNACKKITNYYAKLPEEEPKASGQCTFILIVYIVWFSIGLAIMFMRMIALYLMYKARKFLKRKKVERERR